MTSTKAANHSANLAANLPRIDRTGTVESFAGIVVQHLRTPDACSTVRNVMAREVNDLMQQARRSLDPAHAERCRQTAAAWQTLINLHAAIKRVVPR